MKLLRFHPRLALALAVSLTAIALSGSAWAQATNPFANASNLQVLDPETTAKQLGRTMKGFAQSLGVRCTHCHVGEEGKPLSTYDFASDDKANKLIARNMLTMVSELNQKLLPEAVHPQSPQVSIECATCHRGQASPEQIQDRLRRVSAEQGVAEAIKVYRQLRQEFYGRQGLDFGNQPLIDLAEGTFGRGKLAESRAWLDTALEFDPRCATCLFYRARQLAAADQNQAAIADLELLLEIQPNAPPVIALLESLRAKVSANDG